MNLAKARDFYSDYYEGSLEDGLRQAFERAKASDPHIEADYREFCLAMDKLNSLAEIEIEVPQTLHETISARIDRHIWETERATPRKGIFSWRLPIYGAVAAAAIASTIFAINRQSDGGPSEASFIPGTRVQRDTPPPSLAVVDGSVHLKYASKEKLKITVRDDVSGLIIKELNPGKGNVDSPITNERPDPVIVKIEFSDGSAPIRLVIPGTRTEAKLSGEGKLSELAVAISETYRVPVLLPESDDARVKWSFAAADTVGTLPAALAADGVLLETRSNGFLALSR